MPGGGARDARGERGESAIAARTILTDVDIGTSKMEALMLRSTIALATAALALVVMPVAALGQDEPVAFEWTATPGEVEGTGTVEATDPRASGTLVVGIGEVLFAEPAHLGSFSVRLTNPDGAWTGTGRTYGAGDTKDVTIWEMTGEGGHKGLSLFLFDEPGDTASWGLVIASEAIPPYPDVPPQ